MMLTQERRTLLYQTSPRSLRMVCGEGGRERKKKGGQEKKEKGGRERKEKGGRGRGR